MNALEIHELAQSLCANLVQIGDDEERKTAKINETLMSLEHVDAFNVMAAALHESTAYCLFLAEFIGTHLPDQDVQSSITAWNEKRKNDIVNRQIDQLDQQFNSNNSED